MTAHAESNFLYQWVRKIYLKRFIFLHGLFPMRYPMLRKFLGMCFFSNVFSLYKFSTLRKFYDNSRVKDWKQKWCILTTKFLHEISLWTVQHLASFRIVLEDPRISFAHFQASFSPWYFSMRPGHLFFYQATKFSMQGSLHLTLKNLQKDVGRILIWKFWRDFNIFYCPH